MKDTAKCVNNTGVFWFPCFCIILQSILYGFGDPISKAAYDAMLVLSLLSLRYLIALAVCLVFGWKRIWQGVKQCSWKDWLLPSVCIAGSYVLSNLALGMSAATSVAFLRSLSTVMTPILALAAYRNRYQWKHIPVQLLVVAGLYLPGIDGRVFFYYAWREAFRGGNRWIRNHTGLCGCGNDNGREVEDRRVLSKNEIFAIKGEKHDLQCTGLL